MCLQLRGGLVGPASTVLVGPRRQQFGRRGFPGHNRELTVLVAMKQQRLD